MLWLCFSIEKFIVVFHLSEYNRMPVFYPYSFDISGIISYIYLRPECLALLITLNYLYIPPCHHIYNKKISN